MKNELLAQGLSELDDDLIQEAHLPLPKKKRAFTAFSHYMAAAACLVLIFSAAFILLKDTKKFAVSINSSDMFVYDTLNNPKELKIESVMQQRINAGMEISLNISTEGEEVFISAGDGGLIIDNNDDEYSELVISADSNIRWLVNTAAYDTFELTIQQHNKIIKLTAKNSPTDNTVVVTVNRNSSGY